MRECSALKSVTPSGPSQQHSASITAWLIASAEYGYSVADAIHRNYVVPSYFGEKINRVPYPLPRKASLPKLLVSETISKSSRWS
jgi:hypothetical protein